MRSGSRNIPLSELLSAPASTEFVTAANHVRDASSHESFSRYDLFGLNVSATRVAADRAPVIPGFVQTPNGARIVDIDAFVASCPHDVPLRKKSRVISSSA
jgi:hypothetical protein